MLCGDATACWRGALPSTRVEDEDRETVVEVEAMALSLSERRGEGVVW